MLYTIILIFHVIVVLSLMAAILIQRGRSGGLVESLSGVESIFGTKTSSFLVRVTITLVILFFVTSISLAYLSKQKGRSLMEGYDEAGLGKDLFSQLENKKPKDNKKTANAITPGAINKESAAKKATDEVE